MIKEKLPSWNLSSLYKNPSDPRIDLDMAESFKLASNFAKKYRGKINDNINPKLLLKMIKAYEIILLRAVKPELYAQLIFAADNSEPMHGILLNKTMNAITNVQKELMFFDLSLLNLKS